MSRVSRDKNNNLAKVVRCKDCKHLRLDKNFQTGRYCAIRNVDGGGFCKDNDFCSYGERTDKSRRDIMTKDELNQYRDICREIAEINIKLKESSIHETVVGSDPEYPYLQHVMSVDGVQESRENAILMRQLHDCLQRKGKIEAFIYSIDDSLTRKIFIKRFIDGMSWLKVAIEMKGGNTANSVRMCHVRYLEKYNAKGG